jgi:hypothetical protein
VKPGDRITASARGLNPGATYSVTLHSVPVDLGSGSAGGDGTLTLSGTIPDDTPAGAHTITIADAADSGTTLASAPLTVEAASASLSAASGSLASTGSDSAPWTLGGVALLLLGAGVLSAARLTHARRAR